MIKGTLITQAIKMQLKNKAMLLLTVIAMNIKEVKGIRTSH
jgi:hypothetical protein